MRFDLVIFDFDGVLGETVEVKTKAFYETALPYGEDAARKLVDYHRVHGGVSRVLKFEWLFREVLRKPLTPEISDSLCSRFASKVLERMFTEPMVPGARETLEALYGKVPLCVATGMPDEELRLILEKRGLARFFFAAHGTPPAKAELVARCVREAGVAPERALMVGDSITDFEAAVSAGTAFYGRGPVSPDHPWHEDRTRLALFVLEE